MKVQPESYFKSILEVHQFIRDDLNGTFQELLPSTCPDDAIGQIYLSLHELDRMLFSELHTFEKSIEGCCLYTEYLENRLRKSTHRCVLL